MYTEYKITKHTGCFWRNMPYFRRPFLR